MKDRPIAFDDIELGDWLIDLIEDGSVQFLGALAEAVLTASAEDYRVIRPALIELKLRYCGGARRKSPTANLSKGSGAPPGFAREKSSPPYD
jgi:hypothetical protein